MEEQPEKLQKRQSGESTLSLFFVVNFLDECYLLIEDAL